MAISFNVSMLNRADACAGAYVICPVIALVSVTAASGIANRSAAALGIKLFGIYNQTAVAQIAGVWS